MAFNVPSESTRRDLSHETSEVEMNYRNAAGRNWSSERDRPRRRRSSGSSAYRLPETLPPPGQLEHRDAPGRNWTHEQPTRRRPNLHSERRPDYPARERGGGDHDLPYGFQGPTLARPFPFTTRQYAKLLVLRGRIHDGDRSDDTRAGADQ
jgi:hypothetical protein